MKKNIQRCLKKSPLTGEAKKEKALKARAAKFAKLLEKTREKLERKDLLTPTMKETSSTSSKPDLPTEEVSSLQDSSEMSSVPSQVSPSTTEQSITEEDWSIFQTVDWSEPGFPVTPLTPQGLMVSPIDHVMDQKVEKGLLTLEEASKMTPSERLNLAIQTFEDVSLKATINNVVGFYTIRQLRILSWPCVSRFRCYCVYAYVWNNLSIAHSRMTRIITRGYGDIEAIRADESNAMDKYFKLFENNSIEYDVEEHRWKYPNKNPISVTHCHPSYYSSRDWCNADPTCEIEEEKIRDLNREIFTEKCMQSDQKHKFLVVDRYAMIYRVERVSLWDHFVCCCLMDGLRPECVDWNDPNIYDGLYKILPCWWLGFHYDSEAMMALPDVDRESVSALPVGVNLRCGCWWCSQFRDERNDFYNTHLNTHFHQYHTCDKKNINKYRSGIIKMDSRGVPAGGRTKLVVKSNPWKFGWDQIEFRPDEPDLSLQRTRAIHPMLFPRKPANHLFKDINVIPEREVIDLTED